MAKNSNLTAAKTAKNDEFYTQYADIEREMNAYLEYDENVFRDKTVLLPCDDPEWSNFTKYFAQNFQRFGLKKLISTSYAVESKNIDLDWEPTLFETENPNYDIDKTKTHGKIFVLDEDTNGNGRIDINDLKWEYLEGDGDFRSEEVIRLRDESDVIVTNPPFSLFREFLAWILDGEKQFSIIGNMNSVTAKDIFPLLRDNAIWYGPSISSGDRKFFVPENYELNASSCGIDEDGRRYIRVKGVRWYTNIEHGRRHQPLQLMTMADNIKYSRHKDLRGQTYQKFDYYDCINVPYSDAIPCDFSGYMGVPISFLDKYCPEQFDIVGLLAGNIKGLAGIPSTIDKDGPYINGILSYGRIIIRKKQ